MKFDRQSGSFLQDDNAPIPIAEVEQTLNYFQASLANQFDRTTSQLILNQISLADFERSLSEQIKAGLMQTTVFAAGGQENINQSAVRFQYYGATGNQLRRRYGAIANLSVKISNGELSEAQIRDRVRRVSNEVYTTFNRTTLIRRQLEQNHNEGRRFLSPDSDHCPDCPLYQTSGFVPLAEIVPIGHACVCGGHCNCGIITRFNPDRAIAELRGQVSLQDQISEAIKNQERILQGPTLEDIEKLLLRKIGPKRRQAIGFG